MSQNLVSLNLTAEQLTAVDSALTSLEAALSGLIALLIPQKRSRCKMGEKSEAFCRQALRVLAQNPQIVTPNLAASGAIDDLAALDQLRLRLVRLTRLAERGSDTDIALGSDVMAASLQVYNLLKTSSEGEGLIALRKELGLRFVKGPRQPDVKAA